MIPEPINMPLVGSEPCAGCNLRVVCKYGRVACDCFYRYVLDGEFSGAYDIDPNEDFPNRDVFKMVFGSR